MSRWQAFGIHFGISFAIFLALAWVIVRVWYPDFFFEIDGGWEGLRIIIGVDLVLGPLLTLVVYRAGKPGLRTDLTLIGLLQFSCLLAGMWIVYSERPLALVYVDGHFYSMSADSYREAEREVPDLDHLAGASPKRVRVTLPEDAIEQSTIRSAAFTSGTPLRVLAERYEPLTLSARDIEEAYPLEKIKIRDAEHGKLADWQRAHPQPLESVAFFPLGSRYRYMFMGYDRQTLDYIGLLYTPGPL
ncbi:MAG: hypothetical protein AAF515_17255 [Pseudomonadota bacterium]